MPIKFCPSCGNHLGSKAEQVCSRCKLKIIPCETKYDYMYYIELAKERYPEREPSMGGLSILNEMKKSQNMLRNTIAYTAH